VALCIAGDVLLILAGVAGAGVLVERWPQTLVLVRYLGALFMLAYGAMAARRALQGSGSLQAAHARQAGLGRTLLTCLLLSFLNPHVYLDTVVLLGGMASRYPGGLRWVFAAGACAASLVWFTCLGFGARLLQPVLARPLAWRLLDGAVAVSMLAMALLLLWQIG
jgi:L-lysine exporter family protein LysE/ArgO